MLLVLVCLALLCQTGPLVVLPVTCMKRVPVCECGPCSKWNPAATVTPCKKRLVVVILRVG